MKKSIHKASLRRLLRQIHENEKGQVSIETVLILAAVAIPILIVIIKFGWPRIKAFFDKGMTDLEGGAGATTNTP